MRVISKFRKLLGIGIAVLEDVRMEGPDVIASVRLARRQRDRCGICRRRCPGYDAGEGRRRWRTLDFGAVRMFLEAQAPRVLCPRHGVRVAARDSRRADAQESALIDSASTSAAIAHGLRGKLVRIRPRRPRPRMSKWRAHPGCCRRRSTAVPYRERRATWPELSVKTASVCLPAA